MHLDVTLFALFVKKTKISQNRRMEMKNYHTNYYTILFQLGNRKFCVILTSNKTPVYLGRDFSLV